MMNPTEQTRPKRLADKDGLHKRRGIWHYKLRIAGRWKEYSTHTKNYQEARKCFQIAAKAQEEGRLPGDKGKWLFEKGADSWLASRETENLAENTRRIERERIKPLLTAFRGFRLNSFTLDHIKAYTKARAAKVGPRTINLEIKLLRMILKDARCWSAIAEDYKPLREDTRGPGVALTSEQERCLFETASRKPEWEAAYLATLVAVNTTMRGCELKGLRMGSVDLFNRTVTIRRESTKTDAGRREIPLSDTAQWALERLVERAQSLGSSDPEHYLFPAYQFRRTKVGTACGGTGYDPAHPMKTWRTAWRSLRKASGLPTLRFHDLRHTCITKLAEAGVPDHVLMSISGHISPGMIKHYAHVRSKAKESAVASINSYLPGQGDSVPVTRPN
jgi:integrase